MLLHTATITERNNGTRVRYGWSCTCGAVDHIKQPITRERAIEHAAAHLSGIHGQRGTKAD